MEESLEKVSNDVILVEIELYNSEPVFLFDLFGLWPTPPPPLLEVIVQVSRFCFVAKLHKS